MTDQPEGRALTMAEINAKLRANRCTPACAEQHTYVPPCQATITTDTEPHVCKPGASLYYCPTSGRTESDCHGGFDTCCDRPDLHQLACGHCGGTGCDPEDPGDWIPEAGRHNGASPCPECTEKGLPPRLPIAATQQLSRRRALAFNAVGPAINAAGYWLPLSARRAVADAVLATLTDPDAGYCPDCGRGDAGPTADEYEQQRQRADTAASRLAALKRAHVAMAEQAGREQAALNRVRAVLECLDGFADLTISATDRSLYQGIATDLRAALDPTA